MIEVGTFENFLPALFAQRNELSSLTYSRDMGPSLPSPEAQQGHDRVLFESRLNGYSETSAPHVFQEYLDTSFL